jgi:hypothetical protein
MDERDAETPGSPGQVAGPPARRDRLAAALRANLARRKAQVRARAEAAARQDEGEETR